MSEPQKLILSWNIRDGAESEYFEFMVTEFIPVVRQLGIDDPQVWYTAYGDCEQILVSGVTETNEHMRVLLRSEEWATLRDRLDDLVDDLHERVIKATGGFQI